MTAIVFAIVTGHVIICAKPESLTQILKYSPPMSFCGQLIFY